MNNRRGGGLIISVTAAFGWLSVEASAQCAMCKQALESSPDGAAISSGLNLAIAILLVPAVAMFAGIFGIFYRYRDVHQSDRGDE